MKSPWHDHSPFSTQAYIDSVTLPAIEAGLAKAGKSREGFELSVPVLWYRPLRAGKVATQSALPSRFDTRARALAPLAWVTWGELNTMSKQGRWKEMGTLITDDMINAFGVMGEPHEIAPEMLRRYGGYVDRTSASFRSPMMSSAPQLSRALRAG